MRVVRWLFPNVEQRRPVRYPRTYERVSPKGMRCPLGEVVDISEGGMRIRCSAKPTAEIGIATKFNLQGDRQSLSVAGKIVWIKRLGRKQFEIGVRFESLLEPVARMLMDLARNGFVRVEDHAPKNPTGSARVGGASQPSAKGSPDAKGQKSDAPPPDPEAEHVDIGIQASMEIEDLYMLMGIVQNATQDAIHKAYRDLARKLHPDHNKASDASERFANLHKAYTILRDPIKRRKYDAMLTAARERESAA